MSELPSEMTAAQYRQYRETGQVPMGAPAAKPSSRSVGFMPLATNLPEGRKTTHVPGKMNKLELRFKTEVLEPMRQRGQLESYAFEAMKLRLAEATFYTPDFFVVRPGLVYEFFETKGHWEDDARVKIKVAARMYPMFQFYAVQLIDKSKWKFERF